MLRGENVAGCKIVTFSCRYACFRLMFTHWDEVGKVKPSACSISGQSQNHKVTFGTPPNAPPIRSSLMLLRLASAAAARASLLLLLQVMLLVVMMLTEMVVLIKSN